MVGQQGAMNGHVLAHRVVRAEDDAAGVVGDMDVLGQPAEHGALEDVIVGPQDGSLLECHAAFQDAAGTYHHVLVHQTKRADLDVRADLG